MKKLILFVIVGMSIVFNTLPAEAKANFATVDHFDKQYVKRLKEINNTLNLANGYDGKWVAATGPFYAWGWSLDAIALLNMYKATNDLRYLQTFVSQADYILTQRDSIRNVESFSGSGLSLPVWSDNGSYSLSKKFRFAYPVHTGLIALPYLTFIDLVRQNALEQYSEKAKRYLTEIGSALEVHNQDSMWYNESATEGYYRSHPYGEGDVDEAGQMAIPNRINMYLAAAGYYDYLAGTSIYKERIEKSLAYFKSHYLKLDEEYNSYYWRYWEGKNFLYEDVSHGAFTILGLYILQHDLGYRVFSDSEMYAFYSIPKKLIKFDPSRGILVRKAVHPGLLERTYYYTAKQNRFYYTILNWYFIKEIDPSTKYMMRQVYESYYQDPSQKRTNLYFLSQLILDERGNQSVNIPKKNK